MAIVQIPARNNKQGKKPGRYYICWKERDSKGKRKTVYLKGESFKTKKEARAREDEINIERREGVFSQPSKETFAEVANDWLGTKEGHVKPVTYQKYEIVLRRHLNPVFGERPVRFLNMREIEKHIAEKKEKFSASYANLALFVAKSVLAKAADWHIIKDSPAKKIKYYPEPRKEIELIPPEELSLVLPHMTDRFKALTLTMYLTGLRIGEAVHLKWEDFDFNKRELSVQRYLKTPAAKRTIPLRDELIMELMFWKEGAVHGSEGWVFTTSSGKHVSANTFRTWGWYRALRKAEARERTPTP